MNIIEINYADLLNKIKSTCPKSGPEIYITVFDYLKDNKISHISGEDTVKIINIIKSLDDKLKVILDEYASINITMTSSIM